MSPEKKFELGDYVEVRDRIKLFYELYAKGSLVTDSVDILTAPDGAQRVLVRALAYRNPEDVHPGVGHSWLLLPGSTPYTKGSEVENAETSAWGRAIGSLGILIDASIATTNEIADKSGDHPAIEAKPEQAVADGPWSEGPLTVEGATFLNSTSGMDGEIRVGPDGPRLGFGLALDGTKKIPQVVATGDLAIDIHDAIGNNGRNLHGLKVTVSGELWRVPWSKDGKPRPPFTRLILARIETPEWTLPVPESV